MALDLFLYIFAGRSISFENNPLGLFAVITNLLLLAIIFNSLLITLGSSTTTRMLSFV
jgi:hypothetical protein